MDWEKTLNIFLIAFLLLNVVLAAQLWIIPVLFDPANRVSQEQVDAALEKLGQSQITVAVQVPRKLTRLQALAVGSLPLDKDQTAQLLLGAGWAKSVAGAAVEYRSDRGTVVFHVDGRISYERAMLPLKGVTSDAKARKAAADFLGATLGLPADADKGKVFPRPDGMRDIVYSQSWQRKDMDISQIIITVDGGCQVVAMDYYWVEILGFVGEKLLTLPATTALTVVASSLPERSTISILKLSWYRAPTLANQWQVSPVWVVGTVEGNRYYINAHTGVFEGERIIPGRKTPAGVE